MNPGLLIVKSNVLVSASKNANGNSVCRPMGGTEGKRLTSTCAPPKRRT